MSLTNKISQRISVKLNYDKEKTAVINYGLFAFVQFFVALSLVVITGLFMGMFFQALIVSFAASILRVYSGGVHATKPSICLIVGTAATIINMLIARCLTNYLLIEYVLVIDAFILGLAYCLIAKYAPVDSPAKPIRTKEKRKKMRRNSFIVLTTYVAVISVLMSAYFIKEYSIYVEYATCICIAVGWQVFNLTIIGHRVLNKVDSIINHILFRKRRDSNEEN